MNFMNILQLYRPFTTAFEINTEEQDNTEVPGIFVLLHQ